MTFNLDKDREVVANICYEPKYDQLELHILKRSLCVRIIVTTNEDIQEYLEDNLDAQQHNAGEDIIFTDNERVAIGTYVRTDTDERVFHVVTSANDVVLSSTWAL